MAYDKEKRYSIETISIYYKNANINKYFSNLVNVTSIFTIKLYRLRLWYLGCRFNFTLISGKKY